MEPLPFSGFRRFMYFCTPLARKVSSAVQATEKESTRRFERSAITTTTKTPRPLKTFLSFLFLFFYFHSTRNHRYWNVKKDEGRCQQNVSVSIFLFFFFYCFGSTGRNNSFEILLYFLVTNVTNSCLFLSQLCSISFVSFVFYYSRLSTTVEFFFSMH